MAAIQTSVLRDHLCWLWRVGSDSTHPGLSQAALLGGAGAGASWAWSTPAWTTCSARSAHAWAINQHKPLLPNANLAAVMLDCVLLAQLLFNKQTHCQK